MIVFSATHKASGRAFVGSCRVDLDFHWAMLLTQAEEGVPGPLYDLLRTEGADGFDVAEYADADNARELSALCREAQEELQAELIRSVTQRKEVTATIDKSLLEGTDEDADDDLDGWLQDRRQQQEQQQLQQKQKPQPLQTPDPVPVNPATTSVALRQTKSTEDAADMRALIASIEARRKSQLKSSGPAKSVRSASKASSRKPASGGKAKVESAAARERRIKAALAEEKAAREAAKQRKVAAEADDMAALMARLDARTKVAESIRRRR
ncbi:hypothetical protein [Simiduia agarivorans]|uniref:Uncharacterized protein n=1 Tax=Simiduia agarivorans (strain DSM 21679 / JCM 13881 / BCRC 17597 / SA1) TaxID=1117647 RepID=K4KLB8_SIMAS|nr:hypothetical protein [Simiduia agarivorans]AFU98853.1 hypothetical protein M5M_08320 [Simiduia agarivorans SA1 = DSM 21679]